VTCSQAAVADSASPGSTSQGDAWDGGAGGWDLYFAVVLLGTVAVAQVAGGISEPDRLIASAALLVMALWYLLAGRRAMYGGSRGQPPAWLGVVYLTGLVLPLAVAEYYAGLDTFILLALCPQAFMAVSKFRVSVGAVVAFNLIEVVIAVLRHDGLDGIEATAGIAVLGIAFSVGFGSWISKIINQSNERAQLISQLEQTRAELGAANREAGMLAERNRLASEIHDTIAQGFTSIVMLVQAAEALIESDPRQARRQLDLIGRTARENLAETRALIAGLAPAALASATLADAMTRLTDRAGQELGVRAEFTLAGVPQALGTGTEVVLLRVCQEALANVRKHAKATAVQVNLTFADGGANLRVSDDGAGFDLALTARGYGLSGMRARVADIGGTLDVRSAPGAGTTVTAEVR